MSRLAEIESIHKLESAQAKMGGSALSPEAQHRGELIAMVKEAREQRDSAKALLRICADRCPWDGSAEHRDRIAALERKLDHADRMVERLARENTDLGDDIARAVANHAADLTEEP